jgi:hypothetical protein
MRDTLVRIAAVDQRQAASIWETISAIATAAAVIVALLGETFWRWWRRPRLSASLRLGPPDCHLTTIGERGEVRAYYFRVWVENRGRGPAEQAQVFASRLLRERDGEFREHREFLPMYHRWTHTGQITEPRIHRGMGRHCDLGCVVQPRHNQFQLLMEVAPHVGWDLLEPGTYRLELRLAAANARPRRATFEIKFSGGWNDDETTMFRECITIRRV